MQYIVPYCEARMADWSTQMRKGLAERGVLAVLRQGEAYGYQIVERLAACEGFELTESTVYPLLARLASSGYLSVRTEKSPHGPPRRYYQLTPSGRKHFSDSRNLLSGTAFF
ncbi:MAG: PadR family transcriptional regulator [Verrucomicrobiales bacterium]